MAGSDKTESTVPAVTPTPPKNHATRDSDKSITSSSSSVDIASNDRHAGQRLLSSTYRNFHPDDMVDRFVAYLLKNEPTASALQKHVLIDHVKIARQVSCDIARAYWQPLRNPPVLEGGNVGQGNIRTGSFMRDEVKRF